MPAGSSRAMLRAAITRDETRHGTESQTAPLSRRPCAAAGAWHRHGLGSAGIPRPARHRPAAGLYRLHRAQRGDRRMRLYRSLCRRADGRPHPTWRRSGARTSIPTTARFASRRCMPALSGQRRHHRLLRPGAAELPWRDAQRRRLEQLRPLGAELPRAARRDAAGAGEQPARPGHQVGAATTRQSGLRRRLRPGPAHGPRRAPTPAPT